MPVKKGIAVKTLAEKSKIQTWQRGAINTATATDHSASTKGHRGFLKYRSSHERRKFPSWLRLLCSIFRMERTA
jgi:hypothetical protein